MDSTEQLAQDFLKSFGYSKVVYEPDGNVPPDFLLDSRVAVEVRRLNQLTFDANGNVVGLEQADIPLWKRITNFVNNFVAVPRPSTTYGIFYIFSRPIPDWKTLQAELSQALSAFLNGSRVTPYKTSLPCGVGLRIFDWKMDKGTVFRLAGSSDEQSGGYIVGNLQFALQYAVAEKDGKVSKYRSKYSEWWLVLLDYVSWGTDEHDRRQLFDGWGIQHTFDKVYVVNPRDVLDHFEI